MIPADKRAAILAAVKQRGIEKRGLLTDDEFRAIVALCAA
jgi:chromate transport protein ChrA